MTRLCTPAINKAGQMVALATLTSPTKTGAPLAKISPDSMACVCITRVPLIPAANTPVALTHISESCPSTCRNSATTSAESGARAISLARSPSASNWRSRSASWLILVKALARISSRSVRRACSRSLTSRNVTIVSAPKAVCVGASEISTGNSRPLSFNAFSARPTPIGRR